MFLPSDSELETAIEDEFGVSYDQFSQILEENPQLQQLMAQVSHDADFGFRALSQAIVDMGGTQKVEEKLNENSKVNRSFEEWMKVFRSDSAMRKPMSELLEMYSGNFKNKK
nr:unnamed protein product [Naegleria fowleri]